MTRTAATFYISQVAEAVGVSAAVIRAWEQEGLLSPPRADNGYRLYSADDLERARRIRDLVRVNGLNAAGARQVLGTSDDAPATVDEGVQRRQAAESLGKRVRRRRTERGLSLRALAASSGLAASHISAIERSLTRPSVATVGKLAEALGTTFLALIGSSEIRETGVVRRSQRQRLKVDFSGIVMEKLDGGGEDLAAHMMTIKPGSGSDGSYHHGGEEFIYVLAGELEVTLDEAETTRLTAGDAITFHSARPHRWRNPTEQTAIVLWVDTPPYIYR